MGPLQGINVIEFAHIMAGPTCGLMLADMGADVIKLEKVPDGDDVRRFLPPAIGGDSAAHIMMNRNKRGIAVDLKTEKGMEIALKLVDQADVVIENFRKGTMDRLGLGYDTLRKRNPDLIFCELSGFGRTGPYSDRGGFDLIAQGMSGLMSITGEGPGRPPVKCGAPITDITAGILGAMGVCAAVVHRLKTGEGQRVESSLFEAGIVHTYWQSAIEFATGEAPGPLGSAHPLNAPYQAFATDDGWMTVGAANQGNWLKLLTALDAENLQQDNRFSSNGSRMANLDELIAILAPKFKLKTTQQWLEILDKVGVPAGPVLDIKQMHADPQVLAREMVTSVPHHRLGEVNTIGHPVKFSATPAEITKGAPQLGQHTKEILNEIGYSSTEIGELVKLNVVIAV